MKHAARQGHTIADVFLTRLHADFLAGPCTLATGWAPLSAWAPAEHPFVAMADGATLALGQVRPVALETPAVRRNRSSLLVYDRKHSDKL